MSKQIAQIMRLVTSIAVFVIGFNIIFKHGYEHANTGILLLILSEIYYIVFLIREGERKV